MVAADLGYVPSAAGRALVRGRSDVVLIILPHVTLSNVQDIVDAVGEDLAAYGLTGVVIFVNPPRDEHRVRRLAESLRVAGVVDLGGVSEEDHEALARLDIPVIGPAAEARSLSNLTIGRIQTEHLVARGKVAIAYAFVTDERGRPYDIDRAEGARQACAEAGLAPPYLVEAALEPGSVGEALTRLVDVIGTPVGIACINDDLALGLVQVALQRGFAVPEDVAVVGMGAGAVSRLARPRLTSVAADTRSLLGQVRAALAREFGGSPLVAPVNTGFDSIAVVQGETT